MTTDDDNDELYDIEEILLLSLISAAPPMIRQTLVQQLREKVSIKAGDAAAKIMEETTRYFPSREFMFAEMKGKLLEELRGETAERTVDPRLASLADTLKQIFGLTGDVEVVEVGRQPVMVPQPQERRFVEPTQGCGCEGCTHVRSMMEKGIRIDSRTGEHIGPHHIN